MAYFSNSSEGEVLDSQCAGCLLGSPEASCPVKAIHWIYNYDQCSNEKLREAMEMLVDKQGICQVKAEIDSVESFD